MLGTFFTYIRWCFAQIFLRFILVLLMLTDRYAWVLWIQ